MDNLLNNFFEKKLKNYKICKKKLQQWQPCITNNNDTNDTDKIVVFLLFTLTKNISYLYTNCMSMKNNVLNHIL